MGKKKKDEKETERWKSELADETEEVFEFPISLKETHTKPILDSIVTSKLTFLSRILSGL